MMDDPPRLRSETGSLESLLLRSSPTFEPPAYAEEEIWNRLPVAAAAGVAASAASLATHTAAGGSRLVASTIWLARLKWAAVVAVSVPAAGVAAHYVLPLRAHVTEASVSLAPAPGVLAPVRQLSSPVSVAPEITVPKPAAVLPRPHGLDRAALDASELRKESAAVSAARAKFALGDARGALDDVARLSAAFPRGGLIQEREVLAIDCFAALGNREAEQTRAQSFLDTFPDSPYAAHVRRLLAR
jgi:hypothetical protein